MVTPRASLFGSVGALFGRATIVVTGVATAPIDNRSRQNARVAVANDRVRAADRLDAMR